MSVRNRLIYWVMLLFTGALIVHAGGTMSGRYVYDIPEPLIDFTKAAIAAGFGLETISGIRGWLKNRRAGK